jgi:hypothetical protein
LDGVPTGFESDVRPNAAAVASDSFSPAASDFFIVTGPWVLGLFETLWLMSLSFPGNYHSGQNAQPKSMITKNVAATAQSLIEALNSGSLNRR